MSIINTNNNSVEKDIYDPGFSVMRSNVLYRHYNNYYDLYNANIMKSGDVILVGAGIQEFNTLIKATGQTGWGDPQMKWPAGVTIRGIPKKTIFKLRSDIVNAPLSQHYNVLFNTDGNFENIIFDMYYAPNRNENANYAYSIFYFTTPINLNNCVLIAHSNKISMIYHNKGSTAININNCTFITDVNFISSYSGYVNVKVKDCVFNKTAYTSDVSHTNCLSNQPIDLNDYKITNSNNTKYGVYSGSNAWKL